MFVPKRPVRIGNRLVRYLGPSSFLLTVDPSITIHTFLERVAARLRQRLYVCIALYWVAGLFALAIVVPICASLWNLGPKTAIGVLLLVLFFTCGLIVWVVRRGNFDLETTAKYVGAQVRHLSSDLLSSVELMRSHQGSSALIHALWCATADHVAPLRMEVLVPMDRLRRPAYAAFALAIGLLGAVLTQNSAFVRGFHILGGNRPPAPFNGAAQTPAPLVGDVEVHVKYPAYTERPDLHLPSSSGDLEVVPGSTITLRTHPLEDASDVLLLLSESQTEDTGKIIQLQGSPLLQATFSVNKESYYRFQTANNGQHRVESRARRISVRPDRSPTVDLIAPADVLDVSQLRRIELAYSAADDYGIDSVELVYEERGGKEHRMVVPAPPATEAKGDPLSASNRQVQGRYLWDLAELSLRPGVIVDYHFEVTDNDSVLGPNVGRSQRYQIRVFSPRERHQGLMERQRELATHMLDLLALRLTANATIEAHSQANGIAEDIIVETGSLLAALKADKLSSPKLREELKSIRARMSQRSKKEKKLLDELAAHEQRNTARKGSAVAKATQKNLERSAERIIPDLEDDVLQLSDWLERQQIENLLGLSDEVNASNKRVDKLFAEYERTGSDEIKQELRRELRSLERKLEQMSDRTSQIPEDVLDRFVHNEAISHDEAQDCIGQVEALLERGEVARAREQMKQCREQLEQGANELESSLQSLRQERFSESEKHFQDVMSALADLKSDQDAITKQTEEIYQRYSAEVTALEKSKGTLDASEAQATIKELRSALQELPQKGLTPYTREELDILNKRLTETEFSLKRHEIADALTLARHALRSLRVIQDELELALDESWSRPRQTAERISREAIPIAQRLVQQLQGATPKPSEIMSADDKRTLQSLAKRQEAIKKRTEQLKKKLKQGQLPGNAGSVLGEGLSDAMQSMQRAGQHMEKHDPSASRQQARAATRRLGEAQKQAQGAARLQQRASQVGLRDEPIRIPGTDEYQAPVDFREQILKAMKDGEPPPGFADQVKRYYKEIIQ